MKSFDCQQIKSNSVKFKDIMSNINRFLNKFSQVHLPTNIRAFTCLE